MLNDIFICRCEEKDCRYDFITNSTEYLCCPSCGSENVTGYLRKAYVLDSPAVTSALNSDDVLANAVSRWLSNIDNNISEYLSLKSFLNAWFEFNEIKKPDVISFEIDRHFDYDEKGEDYLSGISFKNSENLEYKLLEDLEDHITTEYTLNFLKEIGYIIL